MMPVIKICGCGKSYDLHLWRELHLALGNKPEKRGRQFDGEETIELRNCACGSTLAISLGFGDYTVSE